MALTDCNLPFANAVYVTGTYTFHSRVHIWQQGLDVQIQRSTSFHLKIDVLSDLECSDREYATVLTLAGLKLNDIK
jgi:hypothetical protein